MVLNLSGDIMGGKDYETFTNEIKKLVDEGHVDIVLDLGKVRYINSTGLGILVSGLTSLKKNMGQMKICNLSDRIDRLFSVTSRSCRSSARVTRSPARMQSAERSPVEATRTLVSAVPERTAW